ncbi:protein kinase domain-containing protein [Embleya sp. NPDC001921]
MRVLGARYELQALVGRGGMGEVWRGIDRELGRTVAVKVLPVELTRQEEFRTRFRREARTVAALSHRGVATLYDVGEDTTDEGVTPFLVMEYIDGRTLTDALHDGLPAISRAVAIARDIADTLVHSHGHGLIHRDIKPSNVMLSAADGVKVLDFGIAKALAETTTRLTATGAMVGTPAYLSPEQIDGAAVDGRSDLYSLGCLLYELLAGRPPFTGDSPFAVMNQHLVKDPSPPSALRPRIPDHVDAVVLRLLAKSPAQRYGSAAELRSALEDVEARLRTEAEPGSVVGAPLAQARSAPPPPPEGAPNIPTQALPAGDGAPRYVAAGAVGVARATEPAAPVGAYGIPAPPPSRDAAAHAATRLVEPNHRFAESGSPWAVRFRVSADGLVASAGIAMIPLTFLSVSPDDFCGLNVVAFVAAVSAVLALVWSARVSALIAWMPPAVLTGALFSYTDDASRYSDGFAYGAYGERVGWSVDDLGTRYAAAVAPVVILVLFALFAFFRSRSAPAAYIAIFWVGGMILAFSSMTPPPRTIVQVSEIGLGLLVVAALVQEFVSRRPSRPGE